MHRVFAALLGLLVTVALVAPAGSAADACSTDFCVTTDPAGTYVLYVPPLGLLYPEYADCVWPVEVEFGDESPNGDYVFDASQGLTGSHTFPEPGEYTVLISLAEGQSPTAAECPELEITATVTYPAPPPPKEPPEDDGGEPAPKPAQPTAGDGPGALSLLPALNPFDETDKPRAPFWRRCAGDLLAHRVSCAKGLRTIAAATRSLDRSRTATVSGFLCRLRPNGGARPVACRRGAQRILAPL